MLLGLAIGDALGNTSESLTAAQRAEAQYGEIRDYLPNRHAAGRRVGLPSDDSQLAFWTLESLLERGELDPDDLSARFASRRDLRHRPVGRRSSCATANRASRPGIAAAPRARATAR